MASSDYRAEMTARWLQLGIGPREVAAKLQPACCATELDEDSIHELETRWRQNPKAEYVIFKILGDFWKCLTGVDCEDVHLPADHISVVGDLAGITANKFRVDDVVQLAQPNDELTLSLTHEGKAHAFTFPDNGSWLNLAGLLSGLNGILQQLNVPRRFIELYQGHEGQGVVVFVLPDKFLPVARELGIRLNLPSESK
jgi:hypothetical protein